MNARAGSWTAVALGALALGYFLIREERPEGTVRDLSGQAESRQSGLDAAHASEFSESHSTESVEGTRKPGSKGKRPELLGASGESLRALRPIEAEALTEEEKALRAERSERARTLNSRLEKRLVDLRQRRDAAEGSERARLDEAIAQLEKNQRLRGGQVSRAPLPQRAETSEP